MLGSDRFTFETPNVIDLGDLPPSQPRRDSDNPYEEKKGDSLDEIAGGDDYQEARESRARLLQDIADLDLTPQEKAIRGTPYDPYSDDDDEVDHAANNAEYGMGIRSNGNSHSLPTVEEARMFARSLLNVETISSGSERKKFPLSRTVQLDAPSLRLARKKRCYNFPVKWLRIIVAISVIAIITVGIDVGLKRRMEKSEAAQASELDSAATSATAMTPRQSQVIDFLVSSGISSDSDLATPESPQYKAASWISNEDVLQVDVPDSLQSNSRFVQRYVLATLYFAMDGENWKESLQFLSPQDECAWYEKKTLIDYVHEQTAFGVTCDGNLNVRSLFIPKNGLKGSLPMELRLLTNLNLLGMAYNEISGSFPDSYRSLSGLEYLDFKYNALSGSVSTWIGDIDSLEVLGLSNNNLAGTVSASFGTLARLKTLAIDDNSLTGPIGFVNHMTNLEYFFADRNSFTGYLDDNFLSSLSKLRQVDISFNKLHGESIPAHLLQHPRLTVLDLADNTVKGVLPELPESNTILTYLCLRRMGLTGTIPRSIQNLHSLQHLDLYGNQFSGNIPNALGTLTDLNYLFLGQNPFTATKEFPPLFSQLSNIREISLASTNIGGSVPSWLNYMEGLKLLDLSGNFIIGEIPDAIWDLPHLTYFLVNDNFNLTGTIPVSVTSPQKFQILALFHTRLEGDVNLFCSANPQIDMLAVDCNVGCSKMCCLECCNSPQTDCFAGKISTYMTWYEGMWEFNFTRASYSFDPAILSNSGIIAIIDEGVP